MSSRKRRDYSETVGAVVANWAEETRHHQQAEEHQRRMAEAERDPRVAATTAALRSLLAPSSEGEDGGPSAPGGGEAS